MNEYVQFSAKTKNEAITKACIELGVSSDQLDIQVITEGSTGFFGFGSKPAIIKVRKLEVSSEEAEIEKIVDSVKIESFKEEKKAPKQHSRPSHKAEKREEPAAEEKEPVKDRQPKPVKEKTFKEKPVREPKEKVQKEKPVKQSREIEVLSDPEEIKEIEERALVFLREVFSSMELGEVQITSKYNTKDGCLEVDFEGQDMGILIGKRGQTLDSLQYLTSLVVNKGKSTYIRVKLDTEDYRRRRKETLENLARGIAYKVKKTRKPVVLEPMNPYERRIRVKLDTEDYRRRRKETLENLARGIAYKVKKTRKPVVLEPMNPYERRIIHSALQGNKFVETVSEGEEPYRHVVVKLKRY